MPSGSQDAAYLHGQMRLKAVTRQAGNSCKHARGRMDGWTGERCVWLAGLGRRIFRLDAHPLEEPDVSRWPCERCAIASDCEMKREGGK